MFFHVLFGELILTDSLDPFAEGIEFQVRPPNKTWKNIRNLSGGEKTLSSLALVFALHYYKPNALYVMDEIDAALDFKNVSIVAHYIKERKDQCERAQRLLPSGEVPDVLPRLVRRADLELDTFRKGVQRVREDELAEQDVEEH